MKTKGGFTFVEMMVASIIGAFIAIVAVGLLRAISGNAALINENIDIADQGRYACRMIAGDLANVYRDRSYANTKFIGVVGADESGSSVLTFYAISRTKARHGQPESDIYEIEYYVFRDGQKSTLMRRYWPNPDGESEPGGILTSIVEGVDGFFTRYYDGSQWQSEWDEMQKGFPELVEITIVPQSREDEPLMVKTFFVNLALSTGGQMETFEGDEQDDEQAEE
ncbi:MAG: prepilin-type N-terminal cleavage/methylation domain-containing protein [Anaerohalosphaeraceae bacterium]|nr:prepilin-type N-terminal cleavage/methylation domain-containing protein [Anaerohalosphaeraceae bacterium]